MISIITGDIVQSQMLPKSNQWLNRLKTKLANIARNEDQWNIYRGDSFQ